ncbi:MAG: biotin--[acetyl-CoA-carboxylase] ligase [Crocinitomix sp.]|nr:biotin--[acetyl-CoA-carboxylase] ligase [Crocinitomix sp.]
MNLKRLFNNPIHLDTVDSTNNYAANLCKMSNLVNGTTILTKSQFNGRGQRGATWQSEPDKNLIFSTVIYPSLSVKRIFYLNICVSLSLTKTLKDLGIQAKVKWPNDVYIGNRKVAGILIENQLSGKLVQTSVIGVGLNVNQVNFPPDIRATSLSCEMGQVFELDVIFNQFFGYLDFYLDKLMDGHFEFLLARYYEVLYQVNEWCTYQDKNGSFQGMIKGIDEDGRLVVKLSEEIRKYAIKEIEFCGS